MKLGVGSYAFRWSIGMGEHRPSEPLSPVALLERAAELGAEVVQYADNLPLHRESESMIAAIGGAARERGVSVELGTDGASSQNLDRYLDLARRLDAGIVRLTLSADDVSRPRSDLMRDLAGSADRYAAESRILAIENHFRMASSQLVALVEELDHPAVGVCLDVANSIANGEWPEETIERLAPYARNLHLKDYRIALDPHGVGFRIVGTPIGHGETDVNAVLALVRDVDPSMSVIVEHWLPLDAASGNDELTVMEEAWTRESLEAVRPLV